MLAMLVLVIVMGVLIVMGVIGLIGTIAYRAAQQKEPELPSRPASFGDVQLSVPDGSRVVWMTVEGDRLVIHIQGAGDLARFEVIDLVTGNRLGGVRVGTEAAR